MKLLLGVSALHYSTGSLNLEGVQTMASAHALHQPTITHLSISIVSVWKFRINLGLSIALIESVEFRLKLEYFLKFRNWSLEVQSGVRVTRG